MSTKTPGETLPSPPTTEAHARQIRRLRVLALVLAAALAAGSVTFLYTRHQGQPVAILLDGTPVTSASNAAAAERLLAAAERGKVGGGFAESMIYRLQRVRKQTLPAGTPLDSEAVAQAKLRQALKLNVQAYTILVEGRVSLGVPSDAIATDTLHRVKEHFASMPPSAEMLGEPTFTQRVTVRRLAVSAALARSTADAAAPYFWTAPPGRTHVVRRGDTGLAIARRSRISFTDFIIANAGRDINRLTPGDSVNVQRMPLLLSVRVRKKLAREEKVIANVPASEAGLQRVTYVVTFVNGQEVHREPVGIVTVEAPRARTTL